MYFCKKGMPLKKIHDNFNKTLGDESPSYSLVKKWAAEFRRGRQSFEDYEWSGYPKEATTDKNVELVHSLIMCNRRRSLCDTARQIGTSFGAVQSVLTNILMMSKVSARWVPRILTKDQKTGLIFLSTSCLSMEMMLRNLYVELGSKMRQTSLWSWVPKAGCALEALWLITS